MNNTDPATAAGPGPKPPRHLIWLLLVITLVAVGVVAYLVFSPREPSHEVITGTIEGEAARAVPLNTGQTIEAVGRRDVTAREGYRYTVVVEDESKEGTAGIARIGGLVTFIPGARRGENLLIEVTRVKRSTADAVIVERLDPTPAQRFPSAEATPEQAADISTGGPIEVGRLYRARIDEVGDKGDGIAHIDGKVIFVPDGRTGEEVVFEIVKNFDRFATGRLVSRVAASAPAAPAKPSAPRTSTPPKKGLDASNQVQPGAEFTVRIAEKDNKQPDVNGVARIDGLVVFVPGTQPGDQVRVRIVERAARFARAEVLEHLPTTP
jgi:predicted RNA-binding protein with TRAM domain